MKSHNGSNSSRSRAVDEDLSAVLCEFDAVLEDFASPLNKRHFRYDEHLRCVKRSGASDCTVTDPDSTDLFRRNSFGDKKPGSPTVSSSKGTPQLTTVIWTKGSVVSQNGPKLGDTKELEDYIADLNRTLESM